MLFCGGGGGQTLENIVKTLQRILKNSTAEVEAYICAVKTYSVWDVSGICSTGYTTIKRSHQYVGKRDSLDAFRITNAKY